MIRHRIGFYERVMLPRLLDLVMRNSRLATYRERTIGTARGRALEIGVGSGLNLPIYWAAVDQVCGIDPSPELLDRARKRLADTRVPVALVGAPAEHLPFPEAVFDTLVLSACRKRSSSVLDAAFGGADA